MELPRLIAPLFNKTDLNHGGTAISRPLQTGSDGKLRQDPAYAYHDVPFIPQKHINTCADACVKMIASYYGKTVVPEGRNPRGPFTGSSFSDIEAMLEVFGLAVGEREREEGEWTCAALARELKEGPVICTVKFAGGHSVVLKGVDENNVVFHDPWKGANRQMSIRKFNKFLQKDKLLLILDEKKSRKNTLEAVDSPSEPPPDVRNASTATLYQLQRRFITP